ncbi:hypothetical protein [Vitreimonas flagellata]|uniref:hypothetical protein n=1 Tax=Vitreimonas flagellata TaxID=2560861 RepID=UPI00107524E7|nr:hypothetical protein [Vitreimonas flagellata]
MAAPQQPQTSKGAKSGLKPGDRASPPQQSGGKRPVEEEDVFGGAERTHNEDVTSEKAKP